MTSSKKKKKSSKKTKKTKKKTKTAKEVDEGAELPERGYVAMGTGPCRCLVSVASSMVKVAVILYCNWYHLISVIICPSFSHSSSVGLDQKWSISSVEDLKTLRENMQSLLQPEQPGETFDCCAAGLPATVVLPPTVSHSMKLLCPI